MDTCILSKLRKIQKQPDKKLENWVTKHSESPVFVSVLTIGEIQSGISKLNIKKPERQKKKLILEDWLNEELIPSFKDRILPIDIEIVTAWGKLSGENQRRGINVPIIDGLIAATAVVYNLTLVTENISDFIETGARLIDPWNV